jgi:hypothetical protein
LQQAKYGFKKKEPIVVKEEKSKKVAAEVPKTEELRKGFKYFLYNHHSLLGVFCVKHGGQLPRYCRFFLFGFDLMCNFMFALIFKYTGMEDIKRVFLTVFLCLVIGFVMSCVFRNVGFNRSMTGAGCFSRCCTISLLMLIPAGIVGGIIVIFMTKQPDGGHNAFEFFAITSVIASVVEVAIWWIMYDCCKIHCKWLLCCCPNMLDDREIAKDDISHAKKKAKEADE